ncbi:SidA/IucD/PvdA family monooxygenase [Nocardia sp. CDC153]|uniref:SidA/IucD/PvdA family monooxygenase n=1 Tax=Nocardia sp. CDC153 TaxID=3112167 RepID=UPI002DBA9478|nr:SidA/IucD/PvdA family monooxygenase [Nocardia sp. CDC153]MEC3956373.1 SidA/IucD/PvdA family monooxygenase [Nocardia sp. CDC153]
MTAIVHDMIGIGFGPANIALAVALEELQPRVRPLFLEARDRVVWQPEMLLAGSDTQNNPVRDLVTPRNPRSKYSFLNFLFEQGRMLEYLNLGLEFPLRKEYSRYISWVASHFGDRVEYGATVDAVDVTTLPDGTEGYRVGLASGESRLARVVVLAPGRTPYLPAPFDAVDSARVVHLTKYESTVTRYAEEFAAGGRIAVVGSSQSAVELTLDLARRFPRTEIVTLVRGFGPRMKDVSPFMEESIMPEFVDYYFHASQQSKDLLDSDLRYTNYSAADADVLRALYLMIYEQRLDGAQKVFVRNNSEVSAVSATANQVELTVRDRHRGDLARERFDLVLLATGFRNFGPRPDQEPYPPLLENLAPQLHRTDQGALAVGYDYRVAGAHGRSLPPLFVYNLCESSHGISDAGSFSLLSLRAETISRTVADLLDPAVQVAPVLFGGGTSPVAAPAGDSVSGGLPR